MTDRATHRDDSAAEQDDRTGGAPDRPTDLSKRSWSRSVRRAVGQIKADELTDRAAALTYYGVQAIFPGALVLVSVLGLAGSSTTQTLVDNIGQVAPGAVKSFTEKVITTAQAGRGQAGIGAIIGLVLALWSASAYVAAFMRSSNAIYGIGEGRPIWKTAPVRLVVTVATVIGLVAGMIIVVVTGSVARQVGQLIGAGSTAVTVWGIVKWPVLLVLVAAMLALLYWASPNVRQPRFRWLTPGAGLAVVIWMIASAAFALYVAYFASYNKTYGSLAGIIVFLIWLWITNLAILLGAEVDAELEHERALAEGLPADADSFVIPRDTAKLDDEQTRVAEETVRARQQSPNIDHDEKG